MTTSTLKMHRIGPSILETDRGAQDIRDSFVATWIKRAGTEGDDQELEQKATLARSLPEAHFNGATSNTTCSIPRVGYSIWRSSVLSHERFNWNLPRAGGSRWLGLAVAPFTFILLGLSQVSLLVQHRGQGGEYAGWLRRLAGTMRLCAFGSPRCGVGTSRQHPDTDLTWAHAARGLLSAHWSRLLCDDGLDGRRTCGRILTMLLETTHELWTARNEVQHASDVG